MTSHQHPLFLEPLDVLYLRGNKLFGDPGAHGEALMPPWPSLAAGALRSRLMAAGESLDTLASFRLSDFGLARRNAENAAIERLWPLPADMVVTNHDGSDATYLRPLQLPAGTSSSYPLPMLPTLSTASPGKPVNGLWLNGKGIAAWLAGQKIQAIHLLHSSELWKIDSRLGIALDSQKRSAADGKIYTSETVALSKGVGFFASSSGHQRGLNNGDLVRLGGDGRGAHVHQAGNTLPATDWTRIKKEGRFRLVLTTPGLFRHGWQPDGIPATLVAASVPRADTISGWNLLTGHPKPAQRAAPGGSVYWFTQLTDLEALQQLIADGLPLDDPMRYAEGYNHARVAPWAEET